MNDKEFYEAAIPLLTEIRDLLKNQQTGWFPVSPAPSIPAAPPWFQPSTPVPPHNVPWCGNATSEVKSGT